ncbi:ribosome biogenesis GTPase Der [Roseiterribacter gracilis]|uniref:GTPase Der n=1 Tax=Roseiterribacter gracilis TaxID=2812848 RepID=A0A8S8XBR1_9PROT|nr:GTPase Der [Rhodospirillales bacterium TMPK1]
MTALARVALVGRPNVGKSTLFNRLVRKKLAIVDDSAGTTRDWREAEADLAGLRFLAIDTAGLEDARGDVMEARMRQGTERALAEADVALFVIDAREGVTPTDRYFADVMRKQSTPVILVVNKVEGRATMSGLGEAYALGLGDPVPLSAVHGDGFADLYEALVPYVPVPEEGDEEAREEGPRKINLAIVGRPNAGKSTLLNALVGDERALTGPEPGLTRDSIHVEWTYKDRPIRLVDTAGMRKRARVVDVLEKAAVDETLRAIRLAHVVVLVLDANAILDKQDLTIARLVEEEGRALVLAVNKWDIVDDKNESVQRLKDRIQTSLAQVREIVALPISAKKERGLDKLMDAVLTMHDLWDTRIATGRLNRWLAGMTQSHPPPAVSGRANRARYMTQIKARPPTFALWCSHPEALPDSYVRYLVNGLRDAFKLPGIPIRFLLRKGENPYADKGSDED